MSRIPPVLRREIERDICGSTSYSAIARARGVSLSSVQRIAHASGLAVARQRRAEAHGRATAERYADVIRDLASGDRRDVIAVRHAVSVSTLYRLARSIGATAPLARDMSPSDAAIVSELNRGTLWELYPEGLVAWRDDGQVRAVANVRWQDDEGGVGAAGSTIMRSDGTMTGRPPPAIVRDAVRGLLERAGVMRALHRATSADRVSHSG